MRLVCPNCGAQYEVDDRVIPETGRDVQCSACGHSWYQMPIEQRSEAEGPPDVTAEQPLGPDDWDESENEGPADAGSESEPEPQPEPKPEPEPVLEETAGAAPEAEPAAEAARPRRVIDESVRDILQEEARAELARRSDERPHEREQVETQPDLGIDAAPSPDEERRRIARERIARMRGLDEDDIEAGFEPAAAPAGMAGSAAAQGHEGDSGPRRDLFPDIEEINSTLDSHDAPASSAGAASGRQRTGGFARGFFLVVLIAVLALALYLLAPTIAIKVPALEPALAAYVNSVNEGRVWLDEAMKRLIAMIEARVQAGQ